MQAAEHSSHKIARDSAVLIHTTDTGPGLRRIGAGKGFYYRNNAGERITDPQVLARIRALAIPPAWRDVWICPEAAGHIQATGRDARGRKQYRYHPDWTARRDAAKFAGLAGFARCLPRLRRQVAADLRRRGLVRERVLAAAVRLLDATLIRIGNDAYASENSSYGLTTLRNRHLSLSGAELRLSFIGKSGQTWRLRLSDRRLARVIRDLQELPGQRLFQYPDDKGTCHDIHSHDVNAYLRRVMGDDVTSKHFRTWGATVQAARALARLPLPGTPRARATALNAVLDDVAKRLHNTRTVCRKCYVHPAAISEWEAGTLAQRLAAIERRLRRPGPGMSTGEAVVLRWLERAE